MFNDFRQTIGDIFRQRVRFQFAQQRLQVNASLRVSGAQQFATSSHSFVPRSVLKLLVPFLQQKLQTESKRTR